MSLSTKLVIGFAVLVLAFVDRKTAERKQKKLLHSAFKGRDSLTTEQFYQSFFANQDIPFEVVNDVKTTLTKKLAIDFSQLYDNDDF